MLAEKYNIEKVILFGSRARGDYKRASDIDLAVQGGDISHLRVLERADQEKLDNEFIISGIIDKFSIQFELGWKILKEYIPQFIKLEAELNAKYGTVLETL